MKFTFIGVKGEIPTVVNWPTAFSVPGQSAYEAAVALGFTGTEAEWILSLQGPQGLKGDKGDQGIQGIQGLKGDTGDQGIQGLKGDKGDDGEPGLKGDKGDTGDGWTGGSYDAGTGVTTFTSDDGLVFMTGDLRGASVTITTTTDEAVFNASTPGPLEIVVLTNA